jgi:uncharacterized protein (DUF983 family)
MATCPRCYQPKPMLADKCPHCTADVPVGQQIDFSISSTIISVVIVLVLIALIFG